MKEAIARLDTLMGQLVNADQTGSGIEPVRIAKELGVIRQLMLESPAVIRAEGGRSHFRCEQCGTIAHGEEVPARCSECGSERFFPADIEQPNVESGAG